MENKFLTFEQFSQFVENENLDLQKLDEGTLTNYINYLLYYKDNYVNEYFGKINYKNVVEVLQDKNSKFGETNILLEIWNNFQKRDELFIFDLRVLDKNEDVFFEGNIFKFVVYFKFKLSDDEIKSYYFTFDISKTMDNLIYEVSLEDYKNGSGYKEETLTYPLPFSSNPMKYKNRIAEYIIKNSISIIEDMTNELNKTKGVLV
jgi:hypothetical protein